MTKGVALGTVVGLVVCVIALAVVDARHNVYGQVPAPQEGTIVVTMPAGDSGQFLIVVDTRQQVMGSYHVHGETGNIALRSVRKYSWDMMIEDFNGSDPRPHDVRRQVQQTN